MQPPTPIHVVVVIPGGLRVSAGASLWFIHAAPLTQRSVDCSPSGPAITLGLGPAQQQQQRLPQLAGSAAMADIILVECSDGEVLEVEKEVASGMSVAIRKKLGA